MFSTIFEERDKKITHLIKLGDCLGRSLRENVSLFAINSEESEVTYLTESNLLITGKYTLGDDVSINNIEIQESSVFEDEAKFDGLVNESIHSFIQDIHFNEYGKAESSFEDILNLWENRLKLGTLQKKLHDKASKLSDIENILEADEINQLAELTPQLVEFLSENFDRISKVPEIRNAVNLSNSVSKAFNFPRLSYEELLEGGSYTLKDGNTESIYEMICRQELVKKELLESKRSFDTIWATNDKVQNLASMMFEEDIQVVTALAEALKEVPYLAMASKKSLTETFSKCLGQTDGIGVSDKDIQEYASKIFEIKKEAKEMFIESLSEKYGVNIQNLQEPANFKSLINTQIVIFESLSRLVPKGSVLKVVLSEAAASLRTKSGVEAIDLNDYIFEIFNEAGYGDLIEEASDTKSPKINLKRISKDLKGAQDLITNLKDKVDQYDSNETTADAPEAKQEAPPKASEPTEEMPPEEGEAKPETPEEGTEEDAVNDLNDLEAMIDDIGAELGNKSEPSDEPKEEAEE